VVLLLSGVRAGAGAGEALALVNNWERFLWLVNEHGVAGFVKKNLADAGLSGAVPPTVFQNLRNQAFKSIARNSFIMSALAEAVGVLNGAGIEPVLLKGTALEVTVYGNSGLRPMSDADILLPKDECMRGWRVLQAAGFVPLPFKSPLYWLIPLHVGKHLPSLIKGGFSLEIHHSLFWGKEKGLPIEDCRFQISDLKKMDAAAPQHGGGSRAQSAGEKAYGLLRAQGAGHREKGIDYKVLPAGIHFLYLVSHLTKHELDNDSQLRLYTDLAAVLEYYGAAEVLAEAVELAVERELERELTEKLAILEKYIGVVLPDGYRCELSAEAEESFIAFLGSPKNNTAVNRQQFYRATVKAVPGLHRKIIFLLGDIFPGFRFMKKRYGKRSVWAVLPYYLPRAGKVWWLLAQGMEKGNR
jgi:hypothetical protein